LVTVFFVAAFFAAVRFGDGSETRGFTLALVRAGVFLEEVAFRVDCVADDFGFAVSRFLIRAPHEYYINYINRRQEISSTNPHLLRIILDLWLLLVPY